MIAFRCCGLGFAQTEKIALLQKQGNRKSKFPRFALFRNKKKDSNGSKKTDAEEGDETQALKPDFMDSDGRPGQDEKADAGINQVIGNSGAGALYSKSESSSQKQQQNSSFRTFEE